MLTVISIDLCESETQLAEFFAAFLEKLVEAGTKVAGEVDDHLQRIFKARKMMMTRVTAMVTTSWSFVSVVRRSI